MFLGLKKNTLCLYINGQLIPPSEHVKLLGATIDNALKFDTHVHGMCKEASQEIHALRPYLGKDKSNHLLNAAVLSNFSCYPLILLFCGKTANNEINRTHKRVLRILYRDYESKFEELLDWDKTNTTRTKNLEKLMIAIYKSFNHLKSGVYVGNFRRKIPT